MSRKELSTTQQEPQPAWSGTWRRLGHSAHLSLASKYGGIADVSEAISFTPDKFLEVKGIASAARQPRNDIFDVALLFKPLNKEQGIEKLKPSRTREHENT